MRIIKLAGIAAATGFALAMLAAPSAQAASTAKGVYPSKASVTCGKGRGGNKTVNFHWKRGSRTTTIYFNNHCTKGKTIKASVVYFAGSVGRPECYHLDTHGQTSGRKKFK